MSLAIVAVIIVVAFIAVSGIIMWATRAYDRHHGWYRVAIKRIWKGTKE